jgi:hypothetical protein
VSVLLGNGDGTFDKQVPYRTGLGPSFVSIGDLNGDDKPDLVVTNSLSQTVSVFLGHGDGTFGAQMAYATGMSPRSVAIADLNGDNKADLTVANVTSGPSRCSSAMGTGPSAHRYSTLRGFGPPPSRSGT